eukprot:5670853-Amphidinium_carterae.1
MHKGLLGLYTLRNYLPGSFHETSPEKTSMTPVPNYFQVSKRPNIEDGRRSVTNFDLMITG